MSEPVVRIKKYGNRRLYSTSEKRYLTLPEIESLICSGRTVEVTEAQSGRDITSELLTQILLERGKAQHFPVEFLEQMVRLSEDTVHGFFKRYMSQGMEMLFKMQSDMERMYRTMTPNPMWPMGKNPFFAPVNMPLPINI